MTIGLDIILLSWSCAGGETIILSITFFVKSVRCLAKTHSPLAFRAKMIGADRRTAYIRARDPRERNICHSDLLSQERESISLWDKPILINNDRNVTSSDLTDCRVLTTSRCHRACPVFNLPQVETALQKRNIKVGHNRVK
ncbi:hypothetical protein KL86PLE_30152 [uncultured Pleomorphomonas sp.]|uniref:Uncharacterized protein n=1 Tax=uncultured Pleomorphomonas sp. TaxID=442121 RepID=A0A212LDV2_9HYPH|nr:hypothetical protein KL86PLE_30152 [uncultured Pleomorphomonas sp.]